MLHKYMVLLRMKYVEMFAYQLSTIAWMVGAMVQPLITMMVWINIYPDQGDSFVFYFITLIFVERMTGAWDVWELDREIREGTFSYQIVRPLDPVHWAVAENIVYKILFLLILIPVWSLASLFLPVLRFSLSGSQWALFSIALLLGAGIRFTFSYMFGLLGFWITKVTAIYGMFEAISLFFSGRIAPLSLLPPMVQKVSMYLPFRYMIGFPLEIATGAVKGPSLWYGFFGSVAWLILFLFLMRWLWKAGLKKNQAVGG